VDKIEGTMEHGIHFISGLPRSGSTLLGALLSQNPHFHGGMSSPIAQMFSALQTMLSGRNEFHVFIDDHKRSSIMRGLFNSYYDGIHQSKCVFDTSRAWCSKLPAISQLFPGAKVICCVRSLVWILDSLERIVQKNPLEPSRMFNYEAGGNIFNRHESLTALNGLVGAPYSAVKEAFFGGFSDKIIFITYESLTERPAQTMAEIYKFINQAPFEHDFENVQFDADEFDIRLGTRGLHRVARRVVPNRRETILPPELIARYEKSAFWNDDVQNRNQVKVI
jgi:sulfotransferase